MCLPNQNHKSSTSTKLVNYNLKENEIWTKSEITNCNPKNEIAYNEITNCNPKNEITNCNWKTK
jgi:hypothetical protein